MGCFWVGFYSTLFGLFVGFGSQIKTNLSSDLESRSVVPCNPLHISWVLAASLQFYLRTRSKLDVGLFSSHVSIGRNKKTKKRILACKIVIFFLFFFFFFINKCDWKKKILVAEGSNVLFRAVLNFNCSHGYSGTKHGKIEFYASVSKNLAHSRYLGNVLKLNGACSCTVFALGILFGRVKLSQWR